MVRHEDPVYIMFIIDTAQRVTTDTIHASVQSTFLRHPKIILQKKQKTPQNMVEQLEKVFKNIINPKVTDKCSITSTCTTLGLLLLHCQK